MAILDPDMEGVLREQLPDLVDLRYSRVDPALYSGAAARARRHVLRRLLAADVAGLAAAGMIGPLILSVLSDNPDSTAGHSTAVYLFNLAVIPLFIGVFAMYGLYRGATRRISNSVFSDLRNVVHALMISGFLYAVVGYVARRSFGLDELSVAKILALCLAAVVTVPLARTVALGLIGHASDGSVPVVVVGTGKLAQTVASHLRAHRSVKFVGFVDDNPLGRGDVIGDLDDLPELCRRPRCGQGGGVLLADPPRADHGDAQESRRPGGRVDRSALLRADHRPLARRGPLGVAHARHRPGIAERRGPVRQADLRHRGLLAHLVGRRPVLRGGGGHDQGHQSGPVFFRQVRTGRNEQPFSMMKFRTMIEDAESRRHELDHLNEVDGPLFKVQDDPRVTRVGRFLRKTSLDEFPQLINVWKGDMSLVGPRPFVVAEAKKIEGWARKRFEARPGMTGLWQVSGRNELSHLELCRLDYLYVASWSFWWDMQILWQTPTTIFRGRGAS